MNKRVTINEACVAYLFFRVYIRLMMNADMATVTVSMILNAAANDFFFKNESSYDNCTTDGPYAISSTPIQEVSTLPGGHIRPTINRQVIETSRLAISEVDVKMFSYLTRTFINPFICAFGFVSNSLGIVILKKQARQQKLSILWYLFSLTLADIMFLGLGIVDSIPRIGRVIGIFDADRSKYLIAHFRTVQSFFDQLSLHSPRYIVIVMSIERLISVLNPLHVKDTWFAKYPIKFVIACVTFNFLLALPMLILPTVITVQKGDITEYIFTFKYYDEFMSQWLIVMATFHSFVPMLILVPINIAIPLQLYRASKRSCALNNNISKQQKKVTITVMAITTLYIFLSIPFLVSKVLQYVDPDFNMQGQHRLYFWFIADLGRCLSYLNGANDFIVYFIASNNYRMVFKAVFCKSCGGKAKLRRSYQSSTRCYSSQDTLRSNVSSNF